MKDGSEFRAHCRPVAANVVIAIVTCPFFALIVFCRGPSRSAAPDFIFDSEQMQSPPTIIEMHYNPSSEHIYVYTAKSPSFFTSSLERNIPAYYLEANHPSSYRVPKTIFIVMIMLGMGFRPFSILAR
ncbi:hypothetical protein BDQ17DRAFT_1378536 [Cyathus striatus]|nr:hypothetical protein BDQ17DRAFT_1378536 [Cyathus striatus]